MSVKYTLVSFYSAFALGLTMLVPHAIAADATPVTIAIIDQSRVIEQSDAGKDVEKQLNTKKAELKKTAEGYEKDLRAKEEALIKEIKALDPKNQDDRKKAEEKKKAFDAEVMKKRQEVIKKNTDLEKMKIGAVKTIQSNVAKIAADIADERKIQVVLDRTAVLIAIQNLDITDEALKRLNASLKSLPLKAPE